MSENQSVEGIFTILAERMSDTSPVFDELGEIMIESIQTNFEQGGRPQKWKKSKRAIAQSGRTLIDKGASGGLLGSLHRIPDPKKAIISAGKVYAAMMHFGAAKGQFGTVIPWGDIPARPFMMFQSEDIPEILSAMTRYLITFSGSE